MNQSSSSSAGVSTAAAALAFLLGTLFFAYAFIQRVAPSVMTTELMREFSVGAAALGSLSAFYFYAYAAIQMPVGLLTDRFGPRKLMSTAAALCAGASLLFAYSDGLWMASFARALVGVTVAFAFVGTMSIAGFWFKPAHYALCAGLLQMVGMGGAVFGQAPLRILVEGVGWRGAMEVLAVVAVALAVLVYLCVPRRSASQRQQTERPSILQGSLRVAGNRQTWWCALIGFGMAGPMLGFGGLWGVPWLVSVHGYNTAQAAGIVSMLFAGWAVFSPFIGWFSDRIGWRNPLVIGGALLEMAAFAGVVLATPDDTAVLMLLVFLTGVGGATMTVAFSSVRELNDLQLSSTSLGVMNMCVVGSGAVMQPLIGVLLDARWDGTMIGGVRHYAAADYTYAFSSFLFIVAAALIAAIVLRETRCQQQA